jgi:hypothetical protein
MGAYKSSCWLLASLCSFSVFSANQVMDICKQKYCEIVIDAGSTGTRYYLYALDLKTFSKTLELDLLDKRAVHLAINDYDGEKLDNLMEQLFKDYKTNPISVYMYATEGLRRLSKEEQNKRFLTIKNWFNGKSHLLLKELRVLGREEEGILLWLSNAVEQVKRHDLQAVEKTAVIEIGGGSAQVSLPFPSNDLKPNPHVHSVHLLNKHIRLWSISFPTLGIQNMEDAYLDNRACYPNDYIMKNHKRGLGDINGCIQGFNAYKQTRGLSILDEVVSTRNLLKTEFQKYDWYGFGLLYYLGKSPILNFKNNQYTLTDLNKTAELKACKVEWRSLTKTFPDVKFKERSCYSSAYVSWFLNDLLSLPLSTTIHYYDNDISLGWSKGSVIKRHTVV